MIEKQICNRGCCTLFQSRRMGVAPFPQRATLPTRSRVKKAGVLVVCDDMVLLSQSHQSFWGLPKGGMEVCDMGSHKRCAERELMEETGLLLSLRDEDLLNSINGVYVYYVRVSKSVMEAACFAKSHTNLEDIIQLLDCTGIGWAKMSCLGSFKVNALTKTVCKHFCKPERVCKKNPEI
jgi:ADP-ribose pyrophosphatase YjhB (NUDIX family)